MDLAQWFEPLLYVLSPGELLNLIFIPSVINKRKPAVTAIAWIMALLAMPYVGAALYFTIGDNRMKRRVKKRIKAAVQIEPALEGVSHVAASRRLLDDDELRQLPAITSALARLALSMRNAPQTTHNHVELLETGAEKFDVLLKAITGAQHHVHLEYYTFEPDETGRHVCEALIDCARRGVEVRVLWDAVGSFTAYGGFFDELEAAGGKVTSFMPARLTYRRLEINFRNHRKIAIIDGRLGLTGGMNIGNEYRGYQTEPWRDLHMAIEGPAVHDLQEIFAEDWYFACKESLGSAIYFPRPRMAGDEIVQIVPSGPDLEWPAIHQIIFSAITLAKERVFLMTPYFVPTESLLTALKTAAQRGVDVRLLLPRHSDVALVFWAGRSYYEELLQAGVRIFKYTGSMLHAKAMSVDGHFATIGSANLDERSFYLNFEINAMLYSTRLAHHVEGLIRADMDPDNEVLLERFKQRPYRARLAENACRLLSPLL